MFNFWSRSVALPCALIAFLLCGPVLGEQAKVPPATQATTQPAKSKAFLWKVTSPTTTVYLLGSMHMATKDIYPLSPDIEKAFKDSAILAVEIDLRKAGEADVSKFILEKGMYRAGDSIEKHVSAEVMKSLDAYCEKVAFPLSAAKTMKPWMLSLTLQVLSMQKMGLDASLGLDKHFLDRSKGKQVVELESMEQQLNLLSGFEDAMQEKMLQAVLKDADEVKTMLEKMIKAWREGDTKAMEEILKEAYGDAEDAESKKAMDKFFSERNDKMTEKVEAMLKGNKPAFVVVGAGHLVGETGLVQQLEKKKFKVEQPDVAAPAPAATQKAPAKTK